MKKRVKIPVRSPKAMLNLARKMREKHVIDGEASPLRVLNWATVNALIDRSIISDEQADQMRREKLHAYQRRDTDMQELLEVLRNSRDILTGVHRDEMKALGEWGFDVLDNRESEPLPDDEPTSAKA
jgi:hypothetical protein